MDRPVSDNKIGWTGWDALKEAEAFPGQHEEKESLSSTTIQECDCCGEEKECGTYEIVQEYDPVPICESCLENWILCSKCKRLVPIDPQSWKGVEWTELNHQKYCRECAGIVLNSPDNGFSVKGGEFIRTNDIGVLTLNLIGVPLNWELVKDWEFRMFSGTPTQTGVATEMSDIINEAQYYEEFLIGITERGQFHTVVSLFKRKIQERSEDGPESGKANVGDLQQ
jgi:hypothetical protein